MPLFQVLPGNTVKHGGTVYKAGAYIELTEAEHALMSQHIVKRVKAGAADAGGSDPDLRQDGPTLEQWIEAGYKAEKYPPQGYAPRMSPAFEAQLIAKGEKEPPAPAPDRQTPPTHESKVLTEQAKQLEEDKKLAQGEGGDANKPGPRKGPEPEPPAQVKSTSTPATGSPASSPAQPTSEPKGSEPKK